MKLTQQQKAVAKSYARALFAAWSALVVNGVNDWHGYVWAAALAVVPPALRAADTTDNAFGSIAAAVEVVADKKVSELQKRKSANPKRVKKDA